MKFQLFVLCCCTLQSIYGSNTSNDIMYPPDVASGRIVGGEDAPVGGFPYQCSVQVYAWKHLCGCAILSNKWILTAAHCVKGSAPASLDILVGTNDLKNGGTYYRVDEFYTHEDYNDPRYANDIALIRVKETIEFNDRVQPIEPSSEEVPSGADVTLTGWGSLSFRGSTPKVLQMIKLKALSTQSCQRTSIGEYVHPSHMCTYTRVGEGSCNGDSGGPLVYNNKVVGVVNFGMRCAMGAPDAFAKVSYFFDWIKKLTA